MTNEVSNTAKVIDIFDKEGDIVTPDIMALSGMEMHAGNFLASFQFRADIRKLIGPSKKYYQKPVPKTLTYTGNKPIHMTDTIEEYFQMIQKGSNKFREIIAHSRNVRINETDKLGLSCAKLSSC